MPAVDEHVTYFEHTYIHGHRLKGLWTRVQTSYVPNWNMEPNGGCWRWCCENKQHMWGLAQQSAVASSQQSPNTMALHRRPTKRPFEAKGYFPTRCDGRSTTTWAEVSHSTPQSIEASFNLWTKLMFLHTCVLLHIYLIVKKWHKQSHLIV